MMLQIEALAEKAKIQLSGQDSTRVAVTGIFEEEGLPIDFEVQLSRKDLDSVCEPFVRRALTLLDQMLAEIELDPENIDDILLVGGSSQLPLVQELLKENFKQVHLHPRPMLAVVEGAAIYSQHKLGNQADLGMTLFTSAHDYFLEIPGNNNEKAVLLVEKNQPLPIKREINIALKSKDQTLLQIKFLNLVNGSLRGSGTALVVS